MIDEIGLFPKSSWTKRQPNILVLKHDFHERWISYRNEGGEVMEWGSFLVGALVSAVIVGIISLLFGVMLGSLGTTKRMNDMSQSIRDKFLKHADKLEDGEILHLSFMLTKNRDDNNDGDGESVFPPLNNAWRNN